MSRDRRIRFLWALFLGGLALLLAAIVLDDTTLSRLEFSELANQAGAIARLRCLRAASHWSNGEIWTRTEFLVLEQYKGALPRTVEIEMPGGLVGHLHSHVDEVPSFAPGEEVFLFLWPARNHTYHILGWAQGSFRVRKDDASGLQWVTQDSASTPVFDPVSRRFRHTGVHNLPVSVFQLKLKHALDAH